MACAGLKRSPSCLRTSARIDRSCGREWQRFRSVLLPQSLTNSNDTGNSGR
jgi:hypothetical protein